MPDPRIQMPEMFKQKQNRLFACSYNIYNSQMTKLQQNDQSSKLERSFLIILLLILMAFAFYLFSPLGSQPTKNPQKYSQKSADLTDIIPSKDWIDQNSRHYSKVSLHENSVRANEKFGVYVFGRQTLLNKFIYKLTFTSISKNVAVGVADRNYNQLATMGAETSWLRYYNNGQLYVGGEPAKMEGRGFKVGDNITVIGNTQNGAIQWIVNGEAQCHYQSDLLESSSIKWVPYVLLHFEGDEFRIISD